MSRQPQNDRLLTSAAGVVSAAPLGILARKAAQKLNDDALDPQDANKEREGFDQAYDQTFGAGSFRVDGDGRDSMSYHGDMTISDPTYVSSVDEHEDSHKKALDMYRAVVDIQLDQMADRREAEFQSAMSFTQSLYQYDNPLYSPRNLGAQAVWSSTNGFDLTSAPTQKYIADTKIIYGSGGQIAALDDGTSCEIPNSKRGQDIIAAKKQLEISSPQIDYTQGIMPLTAAATNSGQGTDLLYAASSKIDFTGNQPTATVQGDPVVQKFMATIPDTAPTSQGSDLHVVTEAISKAPAYEQDFKPKDPEAAPVPLKPAAPAPAFNA